MKNNFKTAVATLVLVAIAAIAGTADAPVKVFVFTQAGDTAFVDSGTMRLSDSVKDLEKALSHKKRVVVVPDAAIAEVIVEVLGSQTEATGSVTTTTERTRLFGIVPVDGTTSRTSRDSTNVLRIKLSVPGTTYSKEASAWKSGIGAWGVLANALANEVDTWVKNNGHQIVTMKKDPLPPLPVVRHESIMAESIRAASRPEETSGTASAAAESTPTAEAASKSPNVRSLVGLDEQELKKKIGQPKSVAGVRWTYETEAGDLVVYVDDGKVIEVRPGDRLLNSVRQSQEPPDSMRVRPRPNQRGAVAWCRNGELAFISTGADTCRDAGGVDVWFKK